MLPVPANRSTESGFTLIEVLIALFIIAIGLTAVVAVAARSGRIDSQLQQHTFASWVASNQIARMRLKKNWPEVGTSDGKVTLADQDWHWKAKVSKTQDPDLRRVDVTVSTEDKQNDAIITLIGFIGRPLPQSGGGN